MQLMARTESFCNLRFSLRTLLIFVIATAALTGVVSSKVRWIYRRHQYLDEIGQRAAQIDGNSIPAGAEKRYESQTRQQAPGLLWLFSESGMTAIYVPVVEKDLTQDHPIFGTPFIYDSHPDVRKVQELFPEAEHHFYYFKTNDHTFSGFTELPVEPSGQATR
jgi:hypothetical protein